MPMRLLATPHRPQEDEAGCLAACVQMVLQHLGMSQITVQEKSKKMLTNARYGHTGNLLWIDLTHRTSRLEAAR